MRSANAPSPPLDGLGELLVALGAERMGSGWWDFALGKLANSPDTHVLSVDRSPQWREEGHH
jgi:hypothetical protein